jgi:integrase
MGMEMSEFTEEILQAAIDMEATRPCKKKTKNPRPISAKRLKNEWGVVTPVLKKYRPDIDTAAIELPSCQERIVELPAAEKVIDAVRGTDIELPVLLAAWLSFSMSEIRGLRKSKSLSEDGNYISIREVVVDVGGKSVVKSTGKTSTRLRKHRIPDYIKQLIDEVEGDYLVPMSWSKLYKRWMAVQRENGITPITFHDLRHINASVMAILRIPDKYAQERGGWKTDAVMKKIYTQTFAEERVKVDDKMDSYFNDMVYENNEEEFDMQKYNAFLELFGLSDNAEMRKRFNELNGK